MSEFKNYVPRKQYKERSQPNGRANRGFLEKKKDYKLRSKNYHQKEDKLNQLRLKAGLKNPDEFYFKMINSKLLNQKQVIFDNPERNEDEDEVPEEEIRKIIKTQNQQIVKIQSLKDQNKVDELKSQLHFIDVPKQNKKIVFTYNENQFKETKTSLENQEEPKLQAEWNNIQIEKEETIKHASNIMKSQYKKLADKIENLEKMKGIYMKLDLEKQLLNKGKRKLKQQSNGSKQYKFFTERKR